ncbi:hypothetical protein Pla163_15150 [Planctomycetes bacterium Pla163]|uniref:L-Ala-D/L-Glu epimerase n=1 Tax=Rohdeia mirabilis TaxID=2528008 RepID=A0A518CYX2_9BACT|nr:hypothetical protein Pla163_15150 [Planctomycetes bacterium Pla163]
MSTDETTWSRLASLNVAIDGARLEPRASRTSSGWVRRTTRIELFDARERRGAGEDVTYDGAVHLARAPLALPEAGARDAGAFRFRGTLAEFSRAIDPLVDEVEGDYLRFGLEAAALDLALVQADAHLGDVVGRNPRPVRFAVSMGLGPLAQVEALDEVLERAPDTRFKIDFSEAFTDRTVERLAASGRVDVLDLKAHYHGDFQGPAPDARLYGELASALPNAWLEDPTLDGACGEALAPHLERVTWDAPLKSLADLTGLATRPRCINVKPSRFGSIETLCAVLDHCAQNGIACYGGGQFELDVGRRQIQEIAALWYPDAPNDVAPGLYNARPLPADPPRSPLVVGPGWGFGAGDSDRGASVRGASDGASR